MSKGLESKTPEGGEYLSEGPSARKFESDVDRAVFEVYGETGLEVFNELYGKHPDWTLERVLKYFEEHGINPQTSFFRESNLKVIAEQLCPKLEAREAGSPVRVLEVGCSSGKESYSLAVEMLEAGQEDFQITAIDVNPDALAIAEKGEYDLWEKISLLRLSASGLKEEHFEKGYFESTGGTWGRPVYIGPRVSELKEMGYSDSGSWDNVMETHPEWYRTEELPIIRPTHRVREKVNFAKHDILERPVEGKFDVVLISNVLNHYPEESREKILRNALASLRPGGFFVLEHIQRPINKEEAEWLDPYNEWRREFAPKFGLEEVSVEHLWGTGEWKPKKYYQYRPRGGN
jgi:chemotaxis methyl-accepting protein methylase